MHTQGRIRRLSSAVWPVLVAIAICRLLVAVHSGLEHNRGDFYATLPGAYAEFLNPTLWSSPDLRLADGYQRVEYLYGPTQYLTILPLIFLDSYDAIATVLLFVYLVLIALTASIIWRSFASCRWAPAYGRAAVLTSTFLFLPLLQAYAQREFEIVVLFVAALALHALLTRREALSGALLGYVAWFKFFPLVFLPYFAVRGRVRAAAAFVAASVIVLGLAETTLDLSRFRHVIELAALQTRTAVLDEGFCEVWAQPDTRHHGMANNTRAGLAWALCSFQDRWSWLPARGLHVAVIVVILSVLALGYVRLSRRPPLDEQDERWRRALEFGVLLTTPWLLYSHYYYSAVAIVPFNALLLRYLGDMEAGRRSSRLWIWLAAYLLVGAFAVPPSVASALLGIDAWRLYMRYSVYFFGQVLLLGLLLWEYFALTHRAARTAAAQDRPEARDVPWFADVVNSSASSVSAMKTNISG